VRYCGRAANAALATGIQALAMTALTTRAASAYVDSVEYAATVREQPEPGPIGRGCRRTSMDASAPLASRD